MKFFQKRAVAVVVLILAIVAGVAIGQAKKPDASGQASAAIVGSYTYVYDYAGVLTDDTMEHIDAMNASLFAQTGAQILVDVVNSTGGVDIMDYAMDLGNTYGVGSAERNNGVVMILALENISQGGLVGDYCVVVGTGLENYADDFVSLQSYYLESDFAAGDYDDGVRAAFDAFIDWFADHYGVTIRVLLYGDPRLCGPGLRVPGERRCDAAGGAAGAVGHPGRRAVLPLPPAVSAARHGTTHGAVLPRILGTAPAAQAAQTAADSAAAPPSALRRDLRRGQLRRQPGRHVRRRLLRRCRRVPGQLQRRDLPGKRRPARRLWRRLFPRRRGETRRFLPRRAPIRDGYNGACVPFEKQEDPRSPGAILLLLRRKMECFCGAVQRMGSILPVSKDSLQR